MRWFILITIPLLSSPALGDEFAQLILEHDRAQTFCSEYSHALLPIGVHNRPAPGQQMATMPVQYGTAVAVEGRNGAVHLITAALLARSGEVAFLALPSGKRYVIPTMRTLGDGALVELNAPRSVLPPSLRALKLYVDQPMQNTMPIFVIANPTAQFPVLVRGSVLEVLRGPLVGLLANDIPAPYGTALLTATGHLVGINYRRFPKRDKHSIAISAETIREWLHSKSPAMHSNASPR